MTDVVVVYLTFTAFVCQLYLIQGDIKGNCDSPLGMSNGNIEDSQLNASSCSLLQVTSTRYQDMYAKYGRLNNQFSWCTDESNTSWLIVDLRRGAILTAIASQGYKNDYVSHYFVQKYQLQLSMDGRNWKYIKRNGEIENFNGNLRADDTVRNNFTTVNARYIKVIPTSYKTRICMRIELYGCYNDTIAKPYSTQITSTKVPATLKIATLKNSKQNTRGVGERTTTAATTSILSPNHQKVSSKSQETNYVILGCSIFVGVAVFSMVIVLLVIRKRRNRRSDQFKNCSDVAENDCLYLEDEMPCLLKDNYNDNNPST